jgi:glutathione synthase/RimK-type ligase-like ATP-grasp enzyme
MTLHVLYENPLWLPRLEAALRRRRVPYALHFVDGGTFDLSEPPPEGVFLNRMSPSSHTRGHQGGVRFLSEYLQHLDAHDRCVLNGTQAFLLEMSKVRQYRALQAHGIRTPRTVAVVGRTRLKAAAREMPLPFITKHNQGGKGLGVRLFDDLAAFDSYVDGADFEESPDDVTLLQQYITPADPFITRVELVGGVFQYAIRSSTQDGFELCPTVECQPGDLQCPAADTGKFTLHEDLTASDRLVRRYAALMRAFHIDIAGIEFVEDRDGVRYTYDINCTTNYNQDVEARHGLDGMDAIARIASQKLANGVCAAA